jgi:hypothetical protein
VQSSKKGGASSVSSLVQSSKKGGASSVSSLVQSGKKRPASSVSSFVQSGKKDLHIECQAIRLLVQPELGCPQLFDRRLNSMESLERSE